MSSSDPELTARWRIDLAYDGAAFAGFALQPDRPTVVGALREALARALRLEDPPYVTGAGRTDTGVAALAQVVSVDLPADLDPEALRRSLNAQLRGRVSVHALERRDGFDARHDALWRAYRYLVAPGTELAPAAAVAWAVPEVLDVRPMERAAEDLVGEHDFRAFCKRPPDKGPDDPLVRRVMAARWRRVPDLLGLSPGGGDLLVFEIRANAFCHRQVRALVGTMVAVGAGRLPSGIVAERLLAATHDGLPAPAPATGLALVAVGYPEEAGGPSGPAPDR